MYDESEPSCIKPKDEVRCSIFIEKSGYWVVKYKGSIFKIHRIIYGIINPTFNQELYIDHINRDRLDNKISNLRLVTHSVNMKNKSRYKNNTTGKCGITLRIIKGISYLRVYIRIDGKLTEHYINIKTAGGYDAAMNKAIVHRSLLLTEDFLKGHGHD